MRLDPSPLIQSNGVVTLQIEESSLNALKLNKQTNAHKFNKQETEISSTQSFVFLNSGLQNVDICGGVWNWIILQNGK